MATTLSSGRGRGGLHDSPFALGFGQLAPIDASDQPFGAAGSVDISPAPNGLLTSISQGLGTVTYEMVRPDRKTLEAGATLSWAKALLACRASASWERAPRVGLLRED
jgi:hypothetical protein